MGFSERYGFKPARLEVQLDDLDDETRVGLYNVVYALGLSPSRSYGLTGPWEMWAARIWTRSFGGRLDQATRQWEQMVQAMERVVLQSPWHQVMDVMEDIAASWPDAWHDELQAYKEAFNSQAERFMVGYRFVGNEIIRISDPLQVAAVEDAQKTARKLPMAQSHLKSAVQLLSDRKTPNYAKSIAESMSAVEAVVRQVTGDPKATLGAALKKLPQHHKALEEGWLKLYGFSSDEGGIRHAARENGLVVDQPLALYFLVTCSAMVSYLLAEVP